MRDNRMDENVTIVYTAYITLRNGHRLYAKAASRLRRLHKEMKRDKMEPKLEGIFHHGGNQDGSK